jgi:hypothetical protein
LFLVTPIGDARAQVIEPLPLDDIVENALVFFFAERVFPACHPAHVAQTQRSCFDFDVLGSQAFGDLVAAGAGLNLACVEDENHLVGSVGEGDGVRGVELGRGAFLAKKGKLGGKARPLWCLDSCLGGFGDRGDQCGSR